MAELLMLGSFVILLIAIWLLRSARVKGAVGEMQVNSSLRGNLNAYDYRILSDLTLPTPDGGTTQVDHVIISRFGVFVIETKNMSGWIFGDEKQAQWTQVIYQWKNKFQNPLRQNYKHLKTLERLLGLRINQLHNLVVFVGTSEPRTDMPYNVVWGRRQLIRLIRSYDETIIHEEHIAALMTRLANVRLQPGGQTSRRHKRDLKRRKLGQMPKAILCPRCGAPMVERMNSRTGELFLGCAEFPRCRATKQLL